MDSAQTNDAPSLLRLEAVGKNYRNGRARTVLDHVELALAAGEYIAIMGESGVGKSTLLNLIAGLDQPDRGRITLLGQALDQLDDNAATLLRRRAIGFVFQAFHLLPHLSVAQNVAVPLLLNGWHGKDTAEPVAAMLGAVGLAERQHDSPRQLSGGELQRVAIARALVHQPQLVLADEPTGNLDPASAASVLELLRTRIKAAGAGGILVTHSSVAAASADRVLRLTPDGLTPP
jgi:putative ABC transport system ATP-binding protein